MYFSQESYRVNNISSYDDENNELDALFGASFQARWFTNFSNQMVSDFSKYGHNSEVFEPKTVINNLIAMLRDEAKEKNITVHECFFESLEELRHDSNFSKLL